MMSAWDRVRADDVVAYDLGKLTRRINELAKAASEERGDQIEVVMFPPVEAKHRIPDTNIYPTIYSAVVLTGKVAQP